MAKSYPTRDQDHYVSMTARRPENPASALGLRLRVGMDGRPVVGCQAGFPYCQGSSSPANGLRRLGLRCSTPPGCKVLLRAPPAIADPPLRRQVSGQEGLAVQIPGRHATWFSPRPWRRSSTAAGGPAETPLYRLLEVPLRAPQGMLGGALRAPLRLLARSGRRRGGPLPRLRHSRPRLGPHRLP